MRWALTFLSLAVIAACILACPQPHQGTDIFRVAVSGSPGALLSVWGNAAAPAMTPQAFIAGGFVGVDHAAITDGTVGRLVEYTTGTFTTRCRTDQVLWWTTGTNTGGFTVYASGENARVIEFRNGQCRNLNVDVTYAQGAPTFWGMYAAGVDDLWLVGGSALPTGPRGVLVHYDGAHFTQVANLPASALAQNLYKIDRGPDGALIVVGGGGVVLRRVASSDTFVEVGSNVRATDNRIFTVSCGRAASEPCYAVGGAGSGFILSSAPDAGVDDASVQGWTMLPSIGGAPLDDLPGLNGVWVQDQNNVFIVGVSGFTMHTNGYQQFRPGMAPTMATLHGVGGAPGYVLAVGGEIGVSTAMQRGVILVRGDVSNNFTFDGQTFAATGDLRMTLGGGGQ